MYSDSDSGEDSVYELEVNSNVNTEAGPRPELDRHRHIFQGNAHNVT
jgi:hypothetical protein